MNKKRLIIGPLWGRRPPTSHQRSRCEPQDPTPAPPRCPRRGGPGTATAPSWTFWPRRSAGAAPRGSPSELAGRSHFEVRRGLTRGLLGRGDQVSALPPDAAGQTKGAGPPRGAGRSGPKAETGAPRGPARRGPAPRRPDRCLRSPAFPRRELQRQPLQPQQERAFAQPRPEGHFVCDSVTLDFAYYG